MPVVSGTVKDANGNFARRLVRVHRRDTGALVGETLSHPTTGAWSVTTADYSKHYAVAHDIDVAFQDVTYLAMDGEDNSTLFPEWSGKSVSVGGNAKVSTARSRFGAASAYFDGAGDSLTLSSSAKLDVIGGDFMVRTFCNFASSGGNQALFEFYINGDNRWNVSLVGGALNFFTLVGGAGGTKITTTAPTSDSWHEVTLTRSSGLFTMLLNGSSVGTSSTTQYPTGNCALSIGYAGGGGGSSYAGHIDDFVVRKGSAVLVPSDAPYGDSLAAMKNAMIYDHLTPV